MREALEVNRGTVTPLLNRLGWISLSGFSFWGHDPCISCPLNFIFIAIIFSVSSLVWHRCMAWITVRTYVETPRLRYYIFGVTLPLITFIN